MSKIREALAKAKRARALGADLDDTGPRRFGSLAEGDPTSVLPVLAEAPEPSTEAPVNNGVYVQIDQEALRRAGLLAPEVQERQLADEYRQIKRPLLGNVSGRNSVKVPRGNLIMVSSGVPGEGKTFTCINLALSIAREKDWTTLLIDGDVAKPHLTNLFGLEERPGLLDLLRDNTLQLRDCIIPTDVAGLSILPSGHRDDNASEMISSNRMEALVNRISADDPRRIALFDSPPLLLTAEAPVLAAHMGQIVVVVRAGRSTHQQVQHTIAKLDPEKAIGLVLNQAEFGDESLAHGGQYGYGYGYGYGQHGHSSGSPQSGRAVPDLRE